MRNAPTIARNGLGQAILLSIFALSNMGRPHTPKLMKEEINISLFNRRKNTAETQTISASLPILSDESKTMRKVSNRRRSEKITLRMTPEERELLRSRASLVGMSQTDLIVLSIQNGMFIVLDEALPLLLELRKQGVNLNQVVRYLHQQALIDPAMLQQAIKNCVVAQTELVRFCRKWNVRLKKEVDTYRNSNNNCVKGHR